MTLKENEASARRRISSSLIILLFAAVCASTLSPFVNEFTKSALSLCFSVVIGSVFPFMILTDVISTQTHFDEIAPWVKTLVQSEGSPAVSAATNGSRVYDKYGARGARGEAEGGYENAFLAAAAIERRLHDGMSENDAHVLSLMELTERMDDSNLLHRGGMDGLRFFKAESAKINALPESGRIERIRLFDAEAIKRNLSPGGAADMLCAGIFLNRIKNELF